MVRFDEIEITISLGIWIFLAFRSPCPINDSKAIIKRFIEEDFDGKRICNFTEFFQSSKSMNSVPSTMASKYCGTVTNVGSGTIIWAGRKCSIRA